LDVWTRNKFFGFDIIFILFWNVCVGFKIYIFMQVYMFVTVFIVLGFLCVQMSYILVWMWCVISIVLCLLFYVFVKSDSCRCQHGSAQHPSIMSTKYFYGELHITLECKDTKLWPIFGCITMSLLMLGGC